MKIRTSFLAALVSLALIGSAVIVPLASFAQGTDTGGKQAVDVGGRAVATGGLQNPLQGVNSLSGFLFKIATYIYSLSYVVIAVFLIISGFKFVAAQGSQDKLKDAKKTFYYTIIGAVLLIGANVITEIVRSVINSFTSTPI